ncbi:MAG: O-antigen ligase family protein [Candidatus Helarchaeota archaeon]
MPLSASFEKFIRALKTVLAYAFIICSISLIMFLKDEGITRMLGEIRLQGPTPQPNALGRVALMGIILSFYLFKNKKAFLSFLSALFCITLYLTKSRTSYISFLLFLFLYIALKNPNLKPIFLIALILFMITIISTIGIFEVREFAGRDLTLTGRTFIWELTLKDLIKHPILGSGYGASFIPVRNSLYKLILERLNKATTHSHQEILQLFNELGLLFAPIIIIFLFLGIQVRTRIAIYILVTIIPLILVETVIFSGAIFSLMFFLIYLNKSNLENEYNISKISLRNKYLESNHLKSNRRGIILSFKNLTVEEEKINR